MELGRKYHMDPRTAKRYAESPQKPEYTLSEPKPTKMDPYKQIVDEWLEEAPYSALRILEKLREMGFDGGYSIVKAYWSWYGFNSRVEWCACFVSWCANECGYLDAGVIPKTAGCISGSDWFKDRGLWQDNSYEPRPGDIIYFDWDNKGSSGPQDGLADHVGIVEKVENGLVYTVEGNSGDSCRENRYAIGHYEIYGCGTPAY